MADIKELIGRTLTWIDHSEYEMNFTCDNGEMYKMIHIQECCERVYIQDINGELYDLLNSPILQAEESISNENPDGITIEGQDSFTWTFYKLATLKGYVTIRWYGSSNGCYSESVSFDKL